MSSFSQWSRKPKMERTFRYTFSMRQLLVSLTVLSIVFYSGWCSHRIWSKRQEVSEEEKFNALFGWLALIGGGSL